MLLYYGVGMWKQKIHMHTDEYEISLNRELMVCKSTIRRIKEFFVIMERKHGKTTAQFVKEFDNGTLTGHEDFVTWRNNFDLLKNWEDLQRQYEEMFRIMKI